MKIAVVGAGLGGLAAAIRLRAAGHAVKVYERTDEAGGKCASYTREGFRFDTGPSVLTLPEVVRDLFRTAGRTMEDYLELEAVEPGCRYFFPDGSRFDAPGTLEGFRAAVAEHFPAELSGFDRFCRYTRTLWEISGPVFLDNPLGVNALRKVEWLPLLRGAAALLPVSMDRAVRHFFKDPRLVQLFNRYATYNGSDPYRTPATFNVISHVELAFGSWRCVGGMFRLPEALRRVAVELGVEFAWATPVESLGFRRDGAPYEVRVATGAAEPCDGVVVNADAVSAWCGPFCAEHPKASAMAGRLRRTEVSGSGFVVLAGVANSETAICHHNVFFGGNYPGEFSDQFGKPGRALREPTVYLHRIGGNLENPAAPLGCESWFVLVNAPSLDRFAGWDTIREDYARRVLARIEGAGVGFSMERDCRFLETRTPQFFETRWGAWQGSLYGAASNHPLSAFFRVRNRPAACPLAFAGGSAHPGGGIPLVLLSGKHAADSFGRA